jgi:DNA invertase Pin-like site-specific DNA recombinase
VAELAADHGESVLLVFASDRLARGDGRRGAHLVEYVLEATKLGYRVESVSEDLGGQMALILAALYGERAHVDSKTKGEHVRRGRRAAAERGRRNGGPRPFGYRHVPIVLDGKATSRLELVPAEAAVVRRMFEDSAAGKSQADIARELNGAGTRTVRGAGWTQTRISQMLRNPLYIGQVRNGNDFFPGEHEPIVSPDLWQSVDSSRARIMRKGNRGGGRRPQGLHLLTGGLLRCSCGAAMRARTQRKQNGLWEAYLCGGRHSGQTVCTMKPLSRAEVDRAVWRYFETVGLDIDAMRREARDRRSLETGELAARAAEARADLVTAHVRIDRVRRDYLDDKLTTDEWRDFMAELEPERAAAKAALERLRGRAIELEEEAASVDAEEETLAALAAIRNALAGIITGTADLEEARRALRRVFESFTVYRYEFMTPTGILDADLAAADWYIIPTVRADAILSPLVVGSDQDGEPTILEELEVRRTFPSVALASSSGR